jgi:outer membrane protein assembly factor BamB
MGGCTAGVVASTRSGHGGALTSSSTSPQRLTPRNASPTQSRGGLLAPGSDPGVLPGSILVADEDNNRLVEITPTGQVRWQFPAAGDLAPGQTFRVPDDAFVAADGSRIIVTEEEDSVISIIDVAARSIVYRYGRPGVPGVGPNRLHNPDDALLLPDGQILAADIMNCRLLRITPPAHRPTRIYGRSTSSCRHDPPGRYGSPNGAFPMRNGHYLVTEINGDWIDEIGLDGTVYWSMHPPGIAYPSDTNEIAPGRYLTVDYSDPGQLLIFDRGGHTVWRYRPTGVRALNHPSIALPLPNGDVLATDDHNDRVIVVDPRTDRVVWQYGHRGTPGRTAGYLDNPDGVDLTGRHALLSEFATAMRHSAGRHPRPAAPAWR